MVNENVVVIKRNLAGEETWRYDGRVFWQNGNKVLLEAYFNRPDMMFHGIPFGRGDPFIEAYFEDRWFNIFEIHDRQDGRCKGWYCNVTRPAIFRDGKISYVDLALDLLVFPDGHSLVLDQDEFEALNLDDKTRGQALQALMDLQAIFRSQQPFDLLRWIKSV
jgi:hypothetical protein